MGKRLNPQHPRAIALFLLLTLLCSAMGPEKVYSQGRPLHAETGKKASQTIRDSASRVYRLLVEVEGAVKGGTAFLASGQRIVVTNYHVIDGGTAFSAGFIDNNGAVRRIPLRLVATLKQKDLALLEALDDLPGSPLPLAPNDPDLAADIFAIGFPAAADPQGALTWAHGEDTTFFMPSVLKGYVSRVLANRWYSSQIQHQTPIVPGYSGGPLIDAQGVVRGVSSSIHKEANGISYGVLASDVSDFLSACSLSAKVATGSSRPRPPSWGSSRQAEGEVNADTVDTTARINANDKAMLARGKDFLERGDIVAARLMFQYLADNRSLYDAYVGLAKTYDPIFLNERNVIGVSGDLDKARELYEKAVAIRTGSSKKLSVAQLLVAKAGICNGSICKLASDTRGEPHVTCKSPDSRAVNVAEPAK